MTSKERAEYLIKKFEDHSNWEQWDVNGNRIENEKLCAIICVEQIIEATNDRLDDICEGPFTEYWMQVLGHLKNS